MARRTVVLGAGVTGRSAVAYLSGRCEVVCIDTRAEAALRDFRARFPDVPLEASVTSFDYSGFDRLLVSPGVPLDHCLVRRARAQGLAVLSDIDLFFEEVAPDAAVFGVTGTNGKSTVTTLAGALLEASDAACAVGGNLGEAALDLLSRPVDHFVLELSSFQLERFQPATARSHEFAAATILNVTEDHLDRHGSIEGYAATKQRIYRRCERAVFNRHDRRTEPPVAHAGMRTSFGLDQPEAGHWGLLQRAGEGGQAFAKGPTELLPTEALTLQGRHNQQNFLAACALVDRGDLTAGALARAAARYEGLPHRAAVVAERRGIVFVNDSKATNVGAACSTVLGIAEARGGGRVVLIAGGDGKGASFEPLTALAPYLRALVVIGRDGDAIARVLSGEVATTFAADLPEAVTAATAAAKRGDAVVLAPACASFDMFANYAARGDAFVAAVEALGS